MLVTRLGLASITVTGTDDDSVSQRCTRIHVGGLGDGARHDDALLREFEEHAAAGVIVTDAHVERRVAIVVEPGEEILFTEAALPGLAGHGEDLLVQVADQRGDDSRVAPGAEDDGPVTHGAPSR